MKYIQNTFLLTKKRFLKKSSDQMNVEVMALENHGAKHMLQRTLTLGQ